MANIEQMSILQRVAASYPLLYTIFFRINKGAWPASFDYDTTKAVAVVSLLTTMATFAVIDLAFLSFSRNWRPDVLIAILAVFLEMLVNYHVLVKLKVGTNFEKKYDSLDFRDKIYIWAFLILALSGVILLSATAMV